MFQLSQEEWENLRFQFATSSWGGRRYLPYAFTELGATMLSAVLRSEVAIERSILIVRAFIAVRQLILNPPANEVKELQQKFEKFQEYIEDVFTDYNDINEDTRLQLELINETLAELQTKHKELNKPRNPIGFNAPQYRQ